MQQDIGAPPVFDEYDREYDWIQWRLCRVCKRAIGSCNRVIYHGVELDDNHKYLRGGFYEVSEADTCYMCGGIRRMVIMKWMRPRHKLEYLQCAKCGVCFIYRQDSKDFFSVPNTCPIKFAGCGKITNDENCFMVITLDDSEYFDKGW